MVTELPTGPSLADQCHRGQLSPESVMSTIGHVCDGLEFAHEQGVIHGSITAAQILTSDNGTALLSDFSISGGIQQTESPTAQRFYFPAHQRHWSFVEACRNDTKDIVTVTDSAIRTLDRASGKEASSHEPGFWNVNAGETGLSDVTTLRNTLRAHLHTPPRSLAGLSEHECAECGLHNPPATSRCSRCAAPLKAACLACSAPLLVWEQKCNTCKGAQQPLLRSRHAKMSTRRIEAERSLKRHDPDRAERLVAPLLNETDPRLRHMKRWTDVFIWSVAEARRQRVETATKALEEAYAHDAAHDYPAAVRTLQCLPDAILATPMPSPEQSLTAALKQFETKEREERTLCKEVAQALGVERLSGLHPKVVRLLELRPDRSDLEPVKDMLEARLIRLTSQRESVIATARRLLAENLYKEALQAIQQIDPEVLDEAVLELRHSAKEKYSYLVNLRVTIKDAVRERQFERAQVLIDEYAKIGPINQSLLTLREQVRAAISKRELNSVRAKQKLLRQQKHLDFANAALYVAMVTLALVCIIVFRFLIGTLV